MVVYNSHDNNDCAVFIVNIVRNQWKHTCVWSVMFHLCRAGRIPAKNIESTLFEWNCGAPVRALFAYWQNMFDFVVLLCAVRHESQEWSQRHDKWSFILLLIYLLAFAYEFISGDVGWRIDFHTISSGYNSEDFPGLFVRDKTIFFFNYYVWRKQATVPFFLFENYIARLS